MYAAPSEKPLWLDRSDGQLASLALHGDECAFEDLVRRYNSPLFHFIYHLLSDYDRASDVLQQVMVQFYVSLPTLHQEKSFKSWLFQVAHNRAIDEIRSKHHTHFSELEAPEMEESELTVIADSAPLPQEMLEYHELQMTLRRAITQLPSHYQDIVRLRYLLQLTFPEIGKILGIPEPTGCATSWKPRERRMYE